LRNILRLVTVAALCVGFLGITSATNAATVNASISKVKSVSAIGADKKVTIKWVKSSSSAKFKVSGYQITATKGSWKSVKKVSATLSTHTFTGLTNNATYKFVVAALSGKYISVGTSVTATPKASTKPNSLSFGQPADMYLSDEDQVLYGLAANSIIVFTSLTPVQCSIIDNKVHPLALGDCVIRATSPAGGGYLAATPIDRLLTIANPIAPITRTLLWADEFSGAAGTQPDSTKWTADTTDGCGAPYNNCGWGNSERQYYLASKNSHDGSVQGNLNISATRQTNSTNYSCYFGRCEWLSGKITTYNKVGFTYGYLESRIKLSPGTGAWPAFWMLGNNIATVPWPACGELDIMEFKGHSPQITYGTVHYKNSGGGHTYKGSTKNVGVDLTQDYHRYGMMWKPDEISFYIDDSLVYTIQKSETGLANWPFGKNAQGADPSFYIIYNLAMGGHFGGSIDPELNSTSLNVDWVRYYSVDGVGKVNPR
jgi:beta-glucanase (GH16 family)